MVLFYYIGTESWKCCAQVHHFITPASELQCSIDWSPTGRNQRFTVPHGKLLRNRYMPSSCRVNWRDANWKLSAPAQTLGKTVAKTRAATMSAPKAARTSRITHRLPYELRQGGACISQVVHRDGKVGVMYTAPSKLGLKGQKLGSGSNPNCCTLNMSQLFVL